MLPENIQKHFLHLCIFLQACADAYAQRQDIELQLKETFLKIIALHYEQWNI